MKLGIKAGFYRWRACNDKLVIAEIWDRPEHGLKHQVYLLAAASGQQGDQGPIRKMIVFKEPLPVSIHGIRVDDIQQRMPYKIDLITILCIKIFLKWKDDKHPVDISS